MTHPYYEEGWVTLYHGDWRELIDPDLVLTDPPYGETSLDWDHWPKDWPTLAARHSESMWCWGSMRTCFLERRDEFADWTYSQERRRSLPSGSAPPGQPCIRRRMEARGE